MTFLVFAAPPLSFLEEIELVFVDPSHRLAFEDFARGLLPEMLLKLVRIFERLVTATALPGFNVSAIEMFPWHLVSSGDWKDDGKENV